MKITQELVEQAARLSRLELPPEQAREMAAQLEPIAACLDALAGLDAGGEAPEEPPFPAGNVLREDRPAPSWDRAELLACAPASDGACYLVPLAVDREGPAWS